MAGFRPEWGDGLRDLDRLQEVAITQDTVFKSSMTSIQVSAPASAVRGNGLCRCEG
jgi:hypothetical protein